MRIEYKIIAASLVLGLLFWVADATLDYLLMYEGSFLQLLFSDAAGLEIYHRSVLLACFVIFGLLMSEVIRRRRRVEEELRKSQGRLSAFLDSAPDSFSLFDSKLNLVKANRASLRLLPAGTSKEYMIGKNLLDIAPDLKQTGRYEQYLDVMRTGEPVHIEEVVPHPKFGDRHLAVRAFKTGDGLGIIVTDMTDRTRAEKILQKSQQKVESLHDTARRLEACQTEEEVYQLTVEAAETILDFSICTLDMVEGDRLIVKATSSQSPPRASREGVPNQGLAGKTHRTGKTYVFGSLDQVPEAKPTQDGFKSGISAPVGDIGVFQVASTEPNAFTDYDARLLELLLGHTVEALKRIHLQNELREQAIHDPLTGVHNRYYLNQALEQEIKRSRRYSHPIAFLMIDVNRFKEINDQFGHQTGDKVLAVVASLLLEEVRETDIVVRYGGDEFLVILPETDGEAARVQRRIAEKTASRNVASELLGFPVTLSIGSAHWSPEGSESVEEVLTEADRRMYEDKRKQAAGTQLT